MTLLLRRGAVAFGRSPAGTDRRHHSREKNDLLPVTGPGSGVHPVTGAEPAVFLSHMSRKATALAVDSGDR